MKPNGMDPITKCRVQEALLGFIFLLATNARAHNILGKSDDVYHTYIASLPESLTESPKSVVISSNFVLPTLKNSSISNLSWHNPFATNQKLMISADSEEDVYRAYIASLPASLTVSSKTSNASSNLVLSYSKTSLKHDLNWNNPMPITHHLASQNSIENSTSYNFMSLIDKIIFSMWNMQLPQTWNDASKVFGSHLKWFCLLGLCGLVIWSYTRYVKPRKYDNGSFVLDEDDLAESLVMLNGEKLLFYDDGLGSPGQSW